jgi:hypothetical protein
MLGDQSSELERFAKVEQASLSRRCLPTSKLPRSSALRKMVLGCPCEVSRWSSDHALNFAPR